MEQPVLKGVGVRRARGELMLTGRLRIGLLAVWAGLFVAVVALPAPGAANFRLFAAAGVAAGALTMVARARSRLVLRPTEFAVSGYDGVRPYRLTGPLSALEVVGVVAMKPQFENSPYKDPDYFLQMVVDGKIVRAFRGLPRRELDEIASEIRGWKASQTET